MQLLTNSRAKTARACMRLHHLRYELGYRPLDEGDAVRFGSLWHLGQEAWWSQAPGPSRYALALSDLAERRAGSDADPLDLVKVEELLRGYDLRWGGESFDALAIEAEFRAAMINPETGVASRTWLLAGKIDLIVRDAAGRVLIGEHKTTSEDLGPGGDYWRRLRLDGQIGAYYEGARALGHDVQGCLYDVVAKPRIKPLKATPTEARKYTKAGALYANQREVDETLDEYRARLREDIAANPDRYYQRGEVVRLEEEIRDYLHDTWQLGRLIRESELAGRAPRNPDACLRYGRACEFFDVCTGVASIDDATRFRRDENVNPELNAPSTTRPREEASNADAAPVT